MTRVDPRQYSLVESGGAFSPLANRTLIEVQGTDRKKFIHNLCTQNIQQLDVGRGCEAFFTNVQGKILLHGLIFCEPQSITIESTPGQAETILPHLDKYLITEDVTLVDRTQDWTEFWVAGADAEKKLAAEGCEPPGEMLAHVEVEFRGIEARLRRVPLAESPCFFLQAKTSDSDALSEGLRQASLSQVPDNVVETLRIEVGFPSFGRDITSNHLPQEISRDKQAISFTKGCYLGQETVARIDALGHVNRHLVRLLFVKANEIPLHGAELVSDGKAVGHVTSACWSPRQDCVAGLGFVRRTTIEAGGPLTCDAGMVRIV